jgi:hypothetical protein
MKPTRTFDDYFLFAEAWVLLAMARLMLVFLPFKKIIPVLGNLKTDEMPGITGSNPKLQAIKLSVERGCRYSPWRTMCFEQALAAKMMLKRRHFVSTVFFGVNKDVDNKLNAHAWLQCDGQAITGGKNIEKYTVLSSFKS